MRKITAFLSLLVIATSLIIGSIPNHAYADSQSDSLIRIATQARDQVKIQLSKMDVPTDINEKFEQGSEKIELLIEAVQQEDVSSARKHFLSAMQIFNEIVHQLSERQSTTTAASTGSEPSSRILHQIERLERYVLQLKGIAEKNEFEIDFLSVDQLIANAKNQLHQGNLEEVNSAVEDINQSIREIQQIIKEKTRKYTSEKAKTLAEKHLEDLDRLIAEAQKIGVSQNTIDELTNARENLHSASDIQHIIEEVKKIIDIKQQFEDTKLERIKSRINQLESKLDRFIEYAKENPQVSEANNMLLKLKNLVSDRNLDETIRMLNSLNDLISKIENSVNQEPEEDQSTEEIATSLADTKVERIKVKIDRLESSMNQLSDEVDNVAAKRWLNNAFSLLEEAKNLVDDSPNDALEIIMKIEEIIKRIENTIQ